MRKPDTAGLLAFCGRLYAQVCRFSLHRLVLSGIALGYLLPIAFELTGLGGFEAGGGLIGAVALGGGFTIAIYLLGLLAYLVGRGVFRSNFERMSKLVPLWIALFGGTSWLVLAIFTELTPWLLKVSGPWQYAVGTLVLLVVGFLTSNNGLKKDSR